MRRIPPQLESPEFIKMQSFLKELAVRPLNQRQGQPTEKMPSIDPRPDIRANQVDPRRKRQTLDSPEPRSHSDLARKFDSLDGVSKSIEVKKPGHLPAQSSPEKKKTNYHMRLPKLEPNEVELVETPPKPRKSAPNQALVNTLSMTLEHGKKARLEPLNAPKQDRLAVSSRTKAGSIGKKTKINQDAIITETKLPHGVKLFCIADGHGLNGHHVSDFIRVELVKNLTKLLRRTHQHPESIVHIMEQALEQTNRELLEAPINTDLSGSTVVAVLVYNGKLICFNVGDSRAVLFSNKDGQWKAKPLSDDQKPSREDEKLRIIKAGGRIEAQKDENGSPIGPLRVWMQSMQMPGLAMTRSFGDKAGVRAGTNAIPEVTEHTITPEDKFFVVASDGVWQYIENEQLMRLLVPFYDKNNLEMGCEKAIIYATSVWRKVCVSRDDISLIVVGLHES